MTPDDRDSETISLDALRRQVLPQRWLAQTEINGCAGLVRVFRHAGGSCADADRQVPAAGAFELGVAGGGSGTRGGAAVVGDLGWWRREVGFSLIKGRSARPPWKSTAVSGSRSGSPALWPCRKPSSKQKSVRHWSATPYSESNG